MTSWHGGILGPLRGCKFCGHAGPLQDFVKMPSCQFGRRPVCHGCSASFHAARYAADPRKTLDRYDRVAYGLTPDEAAAIRARPCAACDAPPPSCVDHCHRTNRVRGPLCSACNKAAGLLADSAHRARQLAAYLEGFQ